jgi:hypothetical protein
VHDHNGEKRGEKRREYWPIKARLKKEGPTEGFRTNETRGGDDNNNSNEPSEAMLSK